LNGFRKNMQKKRIRKNNSDFQIYDEPSQSVILGRPFLLEAKDSSHTSVFLPIAFSIDIQH